MMQILGFRGGTPAKGKNDEDDGPAVQEVNNNYGRSAPKALRLVYCDEKGKFRMDAEAVAALQLVKGPLGVVSVCGRARQGKSFILNQLLGRSSGFQVAPTHRPCTKGLWMWSAPIKRTAADGTEYNLLLLDSEGIDAYDQTGTYSTQIFSLAVLLSSMFVYNQMGGIDEAALDRLSLVTEMTKHIRVRASQKQTSAEELGQFSPIFMWLLRDFYLDLTEDGRRITPKEYLESALQPMAGAGKAVLAKNEIRDSIRALFPDRHCFALVRPLHDERELQRLDQIPMEKMRPEFRLGLDHLTKFVFERTRPKQIGSTVMTGPLLAGLTQSFLDAINAGAVPTIATSWQNVEENECRRAYDMALNAYARSFHETVPADQGTIQEIHEAAFQTALNLYGEEAVGAGPVRVKYERSLHTALKKQYEEYKRKAFMEAELKCVKAVESMEEKLRTVAHSPNASFDQILLLLNGLTSEYERSSAGPTKWQKLAKFLQQSLQSSLHDVFKREHDQALSKHTALELKCRSMEDKISLISRQADAAQRDSQEWKRRYETAMADFKSTSEHSSTQNAALQNKISKIEEKCISLSEQLEAAMKEAAEWRSKYDHIAADSRTEKERRGAELMALQSKYSAAEARLAAAREQSEAAKEEAAEWRRKHDAAVTESRVVIDKATLHRDRAVKQAQQREDAVRAELSVVVDQKEKEVRQVQAKLEESDHNVSSLKSRLQEKEAKLTAQVEEIVTLQAEVRHLQKEIVNVKNTFQIKQRELDSTYQERAYIEENLNISVKKLGETEEKCTILQNDAKRAADEAEKAKKAATTFEREKLEAMRLAVERLALIERAERQCEALERDKQEQLQELERLKQKEREAVGMAASLEKRLEEGEHEMEQLLNSAHKQRANTVEVLEGLLATERAGHAEANARAEALSVQLQTVQNKLDKLQHELTTVRLNETAAETKLRVYQAESSGRRKRPVTEVAEVRDSVEEMDIDFGAPTSLRKKPRFDFNVENGNSPRTPAESDSKHEEDSSKDVKDSQDYLRFTIPKLKQELVNAGFAEELFLLRNPSKKNILSLYEKCILHK